MKIIFIISLVLYIIYINAISIKPLHMLQENKYNISNRYIKWIEKNIKNILVNINIILFLFIIPFNYIIYLFIGIILILLVVCIKRLKNESNKLPLKYTSRIKRLIITNNIIYLIPCLIFILKFNIEYINIYYLILAVFAYLNYFFILLDNYINVPVEKLVNFYYKRKAINKLKSMNNMKVIGITGSYGKTSTKNIINDILDIKYNVFKTPENYNTPYGLMISINNYLDIYNDYFIAEMGACKKGDIKELCDLVSPSIGVITKIGLSHLESFGSLDAIKNTKFELIESLPTDGVGILNIDDENQVNYILNNECKILWYGIDNHDGDIYATDINLSYKGTKFNVVFKGEEKLYPFETKLLGYNNIYNILAGIILGKYLGISIKDLQKAVARIKPIEHRLSMVEYYDTFIIDDAYNSNPEGAKMALEVLGMMPGKHIIVTPGMIEVGDLEYEVNKKFGMQIADYCDEVILIGKEKTKPIYDGLMIKKYNKEKIHILQDVMEAFPLILKLKEKDTYVLLENDLPDTFTEKIRREKK